MEFNSVGIKEGLGDCLIAAACVQEYNKQFNKNIKFISSPILEPIFRDNPLLNFTSEGKPDLKLLWASQLDKKLYRLHTIQRFSTQMGFYADPTAVVDIYMNGKVVINNSSSKIICINSISAEKNRRFIPKDIVDHLVNYFNNIGYSIVWIGDNYSNNTIKDIKECVNLLEACSLFIGPISFQYHLASSIKTKCLLFTSYMPYYKYSNFINVEHVHSKRPCVFSCEEYEYINRKENDCFDRCKAVEYSIKDIEFKIEKLLNL